MIDDPRETGRPRRRRPLKPRGSWRLLEREVRRQAEGVQLELDHLDDSQRQLVAARVANLADGQLGANSAVATICISVDERKSASPIGEATTQAEAADAPSDDFMNSVLGNQIHKVASLATHANGFAKTVLAEPSWQSPLGANSDDVTICRSVGCSRSARGRPRAAQRLCRNSSAEQNQTNQAAASHAAGAGTRRST